MLGGLRPLTRPLLTTLARPVAATGVHPNQVTLMALPLAGASGALAAWGHDGWALLAGLGAYLVDLLDGRVAELQGRRSLFGNYLETMVDRAVEILLLGPLVVRHPGAATAALSLSLLVSYAKPRVGLVIITDNRDWPGLGDRVERAILWAAGLGASAAGLTIGGSAPLEACLWLLAGLSLVGACQRVLYARALIEEAARKGEVLPYLVEPAGDGEPDYREARAPRFKAGG